MKKAVIPEQQLSLCYHIKALQTFLIIFLSSDDYKRALFQPVANLCLQLYAHVNIT